MRRPKRGQSEERRIAGEVRVRRRCGDEVKIAGGTRLGSEARIEVAGEDSG